MLKKLITHNFNKTLKRNVVVLADIDKLSKPVDLPIDGHPSTSTDLKLTFRSPQKVFLNNSEFEYVRFQAAGTINVEYSGCANIASHQVFPGYVILQPKGGQRTLYYVHGGHFLSHANGTATLEVFDAYEKNEVDVSGCTEEIAKNVQHVANQSEEGALGLCV